MKSFFNDLWSFLKSPQMFYPTLGMMFIALLLLIGLFTDSPLNVANWLTKEEPNQEDQITENNQDELPVEKEEETPKEEPKETVDPKIEIKLTGSTYDNGVKLYWETKNLSSKNGYKIVRSLKSNPVYPGDTYVYISNEEQKSYTWKIENGKTYYFRVCEYLDGKCGAYSNNLKLTAPMVEEEKSEAAVKSIKLSFVKFLVADILRPDTSKVANSELVYPEAKVAWTVDGYSKNGFKLVFSKTAYPTYPNRESDRYQYYSSPSQAYGAVTAFNGYGIYYVRVCEYLGGKCGVYSNQITINFVEPN